MSTAAAPSRRPRNRQGEGGRLREELIAAAARLLDRTGDEEALTLRAVAREAGVAAPSVYLHFVSKEELVRAVMRAHFAELREAIAAAAAAAPAAPDARLRAGCLAYCRFALERPGAYRILFGIPRSPFADLPPDQLPGKETFATLVDGIAACMAAGLTPAGDPYRTATNVWSALHGVVSLRRTMPGFPWPPVAAMVDDLLVGLVGLPGAEASTGVGPGPAPDARGGAGRAGS